MFANNLTDKLTFNVPAKSSFYTSVFTDEELRDALNWARENSHAILLLGGGSNMLFHNDFNGLVIQIGHKGIKVIEDDGRRVEVEVGEAVSVTECAVHPTARWVASVARTAVCRRGSSCRVRLRLVPHERQVRRPRTAARRGCQVPGGGGDRWPCEAREMSDARVCLLVVRSVGDCGGHPCVVVPAQRTR